jgi:hypothetical protein
MNQQEQVAAAYSKIARDPLWVTIVNTKIFDEAQTSIIRVFKHSSGQIAVYAASSTDGKTSKKALAAVLANVEEAIRPVAAEAGCVEAAIADALVNLAA